MLEVCKLQSGVQKIKNVKIKLREWKWITSDQSLAFLPSYRRYIFVLPLKQMIDLKD